MFKQRLSVSIRPIQCTDPEQTDDGDTVTHQAVLRGSESLLTRFSRNTAVLRLMYVIVCDSASEIVTHLDDISYNIEVILI